MKPTKERAAWARVARGLYDAYHAIKAIDPEFAEGVRLKAEYAGNRATGKDEEEEE